MKTRDDTSAVSITQIYNYLADSVTRKTIERDLDRMSESYKICEVEGMPKRFYASKEFYPDIVLPIHQTHLFTLVLAIENLKCSSSKDVEVICRDLEELLINKLDRRSSDELVNIKKIFFSATSGKSINKRRANDFNKLVECYIKRINFSCLNNSSDKKKRRRTSFSPLLIHISDNSIYLVVADIDDGSKIKVLRASLLSDVISKGVSIDESLVVKAKKLLAAR
ncbi:MAG: hypothetical protein HN353_13095 [Bdellovibrionales bacterium]|nr:hypothetical protein [Bdellovibrionales bacterium]MBT3524973.1 hypothetical protein [Bdellovibrionales bacterium]MBT7670357.1 hypothetical protein [Bdellovibrionales bacterium]